MTSIQQLSDQLRDAYQQIDLVDPVTGAPSASRGHLASTATAAPRERQALIDLIDGRVSLVVDRLTRWAIADTTTAAQTVAQIALNDSAVSYTALEELDDDVLFEAAYIAAREMSDLTNAQGRQEARQLLHAWRTAPGHTTRRR